MKQVRLASLLRKVADRIDPPVTEKREPDVPMTPVVLADLRIEPPKPLIEVEDTSWGRSWGNYI